MQRTPLCRGFTLIELMIAVAILAIIAAIAIPAYNGYITEARSGAARANLENLRLAVEDYFLDNGSYAALNGDQWLFSGAKTLTTEELGWAPERPSEHRFDYAVTAGATTYTITVTNIDGGEPAVFSK